MSVGTTRIQGQAGAEMSISHYLAGDLAESNVKIALSAMNWTYGTSANQVNLIHQSTDTLANAAGTSTHDLNAGALYNIFGGLLTMSALKFLYIKNNSDDASLSIGANANHIDIFSTIATDILLLPANGIFIWTDPSAAGLDVSTNKNLVILHNGEGDATMDVDIIAMGLST